MIDAIIQKSGYSVSSPQPSTREQHTPPSSTEQTATEVSLSKSGKLLSELPPLILDPATHLKNADAALKRVMASMSIPEGTPIDIQVNSSGRLTVNSDHEKAAELEELLNNPDPRTDAADVHNSMKGAMNGYVIGRIGEAAVMAQTAAEKNPAQADALYAWVKSIADDTKSMSFRASFGNSGGPEGTLLNALGTPISQREGLTLPA